LAAAVEQFHRRPGAEAKNVQRVMGLGGGQVDVRGRVGRKVRHEEARAFVGFGHGVVLEFGRIILPRGRACP
jgi:hypothetical protein